MSSVSDSSSSKIRIPSSFHTNVIGSILSGWATSSTRDGFSSITSFIATLARFVGKGDHGSARSALPDSGQKQLLRWSRLISRSSSYEVLTSPFSDRDCFQGAGGCEKSMIGTFTLFVVSASCNCSCSICRFACSAIGRTTCAKKRSMSSDDVSFGSGIGDGSSGMICANASEIDAFLDFHGGGNSDRSGVRGPSTFKSAAFRLLSMGGEGGSLTPLRGLYRSPILSELKVMFSGSIPPVSATPETIVSSFNIILSSSCIS